MDIVTKRRTPIIVPNLIILLTALYISIFTGHSDAIGVPPWDMMTTPQTQLFCMVSYVLFSLICSVGFHIVFRKEDVKRNRNGSGNAELAFFLGILWPLVTLCIICFALYEFVWVPVMTELLSEVETMCGLHEEADEHN